MPEKELLYFLEYIETQNHRFPPFVFSPREAIPPRQIDHIAVNRYESRYGDVVNFELPPCDPTSYELEILKLLPYNLTILEIASQTNSKYNDVRSALAQLERIGLTARRASNQHWPTIEGFALIGLTPITPPKKNNQHKAVQ